MHPEFDKSAAQLTACMLVRRGFAQWGPLYPSIRAEPATAITVHTRASSSDLLALEDDSRLRASGQVFASAVGPSSTLPCRNTLGGCVIPPSSRLAALVHRPLGPETPRGTPTRGDDRPHHAAVVATDPNTLSTRPCLDDCRNQTAHWPLPQHTSAMMAHDCGWDLMRTRVRLERKDPDQSARISPWAYEPVLGSLIEHNGPGIDRSVPEIISPLLNVRHELVTAPTPPRTAPR